MRNSKLDTAINVTLYLFGFLLLWEWMRPVDQLTDTSRIGYFIFFIIVSLLLHLLMIPVLTKAIVLICFVLFMINSYYYELSFFDLYWLLDYGEDLIANGKLILEADWLGLSNPFRTTLLFILLWLVTYLLGYWITVKRSIWLFFLTTVLFITVLDTFTKYDAEWAIVRLVVIGFSCLGILTFLRLAAKERIKLRINILAKWLLPLMLLVAVGTYTGFAAPKLDPQWPDPVPFITSFSDKTPANQSGVNKVGYGEDDKRLGGGFEDDDSVVFKSNASTRHYWKVESKDIYTGKGWDVYERSEFSEILPGQKSEEFTIPEAVETTEHSAEASVTLLHNHIPYPQSMELLELDALNVDTFRVRKALQKIVPVREQGVPFSVPEFEIKYKLPRYLVNELKKNKVETLNLSQIEMAKYTQLPDNMPQRVAELAQEITRDKDNLYDMTKAVENYFDRSEFVYDKEKIPYPKEGEDYVDQFLFETMRGYCDNFSSSMVVLLRSVGIPARWAKGYTEGSLTRENGQSIYVVTNNNAHSWVEVYFPNAGWVPFEPTKGFSGNARFSYAPLSQSGNNDTPPPAETDLEKPEEEKKPPVRNLEEENAKSAVSTNTNWFKENGLLAVVIAGVILLLAVLLYKYRRKWLTYVYILMYKKRSDPDTFAKAYGVLLKQLQRAGFKRPKGQTLREYAEYIDSYYSNRNMGKLTASYERMLYRGDHVQEDWEQLSELWENLIKKTSS